MKLRKNIEMDIVYCIYMVSGLMVVSLFIIFSYIYEGFDALIELWQEEHDYTWS